MRVLLIAALILTLSCNRPATEPHRPAVRIAVGGQTQLVYLPLTLAQQLGHYNREGLDVSIMDLSGGAKALEALLSGSVDVVCGYFDHVIQMHAEEKKLKAFVLMQRFPGLALAVSPAVKRSIDRVEDLRGATVGISAPGSSTDFLLRHLLHRAGVEAKEVSSAGIGMGASAVAAMQFGKVDAAIMADPAITILARRMGSLRILGDTRTQEGAREVYGVDHYPSAVLYAREEWLLQNAPAAASLVRAMLRTLEWLHSHSPEEIARAMPETFRGDDVSLYAEAIRSALPMYETSGRMPSDGPEIVHKLLGLSLEKVRNAKISYASTYTNEWVPLR
ncbi:MAG: ABC transporter substrate-binding protein [Bryobacterales bacterium]|nr:ABC transporter substrate-binding protein [Bryobacterales bacterium]